MENVISVPKVFYRNMKQENLCPSRKRLANICKLSLFIFCFLHSMLLLSSLYYTGCITCVFFTLLSCLWRTWASLCVYRKSTHTIQLIVIYNCLQYHPWFINIHDSGRFYCWQLVADLFLTCSMVTAQGFCLAVKCYPQTTIRASLGYSTP